MNSELNIGDVFIDDTPVDFSDVPILTDDEYEAFREGVRKRVSESKEAY